MLEERLLSKVVRTMNKTTLRFAPSDGSDYPMPMPGQRYMLYMHVPFCERLCPYCSFNRFPYAEDVARRYFSSMREEMRMLSDRGFTFETVYVGGGTPTILMDELISSLDLAEQLFGVQDVSSETNPNHLVPEVLKDLVGRVQRLSVGVQSFDNGLLKQMDR
ncbi:MAG: radical SAM protein, partial [Coriobacteriales bacterium]|nr:radical SAM protein [Coriobacteriales bacterium]